MMVIPPGGRSAAQHNGGGVRGPEGQSLFYASPEEGVDSSGPAGGAGRDSPIIKPPPPPSRRVQPAHGEIKKRVRVRRSV